MLFRSLGTRTDKNNYAQQKGIPRQLKNLENMKAKEAENDVKMAELINEIKAREQKVKDGAERAAQMAMRIAIEVAITKAEMDTAQRAKDIADFQLKFEADVTAAAAAAQKAKAEMEAA